MNRLCQRLFLSRLPLLLLIAIGLGTNFSARAVHKLPRPAPEFSHQDEAAWLNSPPLSLQELRGRVLLFDFWTFDCWNCYRSFPWLLGLEERLKEQPFSVIGIHTPEFAHERKRESLQKKIVEFGLQHPVMMDNDFSYWNAMGTRYWPSFYLVDKQGMVRALYVGETHRGDRRALQIEQMIEQLLRE